MKTELLFSEKQKFKQWWIWVILLGINILFISGAYKQLILKEQFGDRPMSNEGILIASALSLGLTILFYSFKLETQIQSDGVYVRFFPFHLSFKYYPWNQISKLVVRQYNPISEYGGWGLRLGLFAKGKAFNVSGDKGLQIVFTNNRKLLIGTNKPDELTVVLNTLEELKS